MTAEHQRVLDFYLERGGGRPHQATAAQIAAVTGQDLETVRRLRLDLVDWTLLCVERPPGVAPVMMPAIWLTVPGAMSSPRREEHILTKLAELLSDAGLLGRIALADGDEARATLMAGLAEQLRTAIQARSAACNSP